MGSGSSRKRKARDASKLDEKGFIQALIGHTGGVNCMDISQSGLILLTGSDDWTARVWDLVTYDNKVVLEGHSGYISCCKILRDQFALTAGVDRSIRKWNMMSGNCVLKMEFHKGKVNRLLLRGRYVFSTSYDGTIICWDTTNGNPARVYRGHKQSVLPILYLSTTGTDAQQDVDVDRNNDILITGSMDSTAKLWSIHSGANLRTLRGHGGAVLSMALDKSNRHLYTGSSDYTVKKWRISDGSLHLNFKGHTGSVLSIAIDNKALYTSGADSTVRCWATDFGNETRKYNAHTHMISDMKFHTGLIMTCSGDQTVKVIDAKSGALKRTFKGHKYAVNCILVTDKLLLSASYDGTVRLYNVHEYIQEKMLMNRGDSSSDEDSSSEISLEGKSNEITSSKKPGKRRRKGMNSKVRPTEQNV